MKFNFRKIASVLASAVMIGSTAGAALAATTFPAPFVVSGVPNVAIVTTSGTHTGASVDQQAALDVKTEILKSVTSTNGAIT